MWAMASLCHFTVAWVYYFTAASLREREREIYRESVGGCVCGREEVGEKTCIRLIIENKMQTQKLKLVTNATGGFLLRLETSAGESP